MKDENNPYELIYAFQELLNACINCDHWSESATALDELGLVDLKRTGRFDYYQKLIDDNLKVLDASRERINKMLNCATK